MEFLISLFIIPVGLIMGVNTKKFNKTNYQRYLDDEISYKQLCKLQQVIDKVK